MPYKPFEPRDTLEKAMSKLWGDDREFTPTTRLEEMICMIAKENPVPTGKKTITDTTEVDVSGYATAQVVDENLTAGNIKKDVVILGTTGSYEGGSSGVPTPVMTVTIVCEDYADLVSFESYLAEETNDGYRQVLLDGLTSSETVITGLNVPYFASDGSGDMSWEFAPVASYPDPIDPQQALAQFNYAFSNLVNCTDGGGYAIISDPTLPCSCTVTLTKE